MVDGVCAEEEAKANPFALTLTWMSISEFSESLKLLGSHAGVVSVW
mgnify:CR=1 FL=1